MFRAMTMAIGKWATGNGVCVRAHSVEEVAQWFTTDTIVPYHGQ